MPDSNSKILTPAEVDDQLAALLSMSSDIDADKMIRAYRELKEMRAAACSLIAARFSTFKAKNGRDVGVQDTNGEKMWLVPFDEMAALERAMGNG